MPFTINAPEPERGGAAAANTTAKAEKKAGPYSAQGALFRTVQHRQTLILQQARTWLTINPEWFAHQSRYDKPIGIYVGADWDRLEEKNGWIFLEKGNAYAADKIGRSIDAWEGAEDRPILSEA